MDVLVSGADAEYFFSAIPDAAGIPLRDRALPPIDQQLTVSDEFLSIWETEANSQVLEAFEKRIKECMESKTMLEMFIESYIPEDKKGKKRKREDLSLRNQENSER